MALFFGSFSDDNITGTASGDLIISFAGSDVIVADGGDDVILAGSGADIIYAGAGDDVAFGGSGADLIYGGTGRDRLHGGRDDDKIYGGDDNDVLFGNSGNDLLGGGDGNDLILGGRGTDTAAFTGSVLDFDINSWGSVTRVSRLDDQGNKIEKDLLISIEALQFDDATLFLDGTNNVVFTQDDDAGEILENQTTLLLAADLLANDVEFDGDAIFISSIDSVSNADAVVSLVGGDINVDLTNAFDTLAADELETLTITYTVSDGNGGAASSAATLTVRGVNDAPTITIPDAVSIDENETGPLATPVVADIDSTNVVVTLGGVDGALFAINPAGEIVFNAAPDFETPQDTGGDNVYNIDVIADDGGATAVASMSITVNDVVEVPPVNARINEIHYDNAGSDAGEFVEIRTDAGDDVSQVLVELYNGSGGAVYASALLTAGDMTTDGTYDYYVLDIADFGTSGIQNGAPDGVALSNGGQLIEFLSYEGDFTGVGGAADGVASTDIGVAEGSSTPTGFSLQRNDDDTWDAPREETKGLANDFVAPPNARINEFHYDNTGTDVGEFIEIRTDAGDDVSNLQIDLYNGSNGETYNTIQVAGLAMTTDGTYDYYVVDLPTNGLQNGAPDGIAFV